MKTIKIILAVGLLVVMWLSSKSQTCIPDNKYELNTPEITGSYKCYEARDYIKMQRGFSYKRDGNSRFVAKLNDHLVLPIIYETNPITNSDFNLSTDYNVGSTPGVLDVSATGGATYSIPISIPSGTNNMQPSISLVYSSQSNNGLLGWGWNIAGLSSITRTGRTIYHDGKVSGIQFNNEDRFLLDGNRLHVSNFVYYTHVGAEYHTEVDDFSKIISHGGDNNSGPDWFEVRTKNGLIIEYGHGNNSRFPLSGPAIVWRVNKVTDSYNNYMTFSYFIDPIDNNIYINNIDYTSNDIENLSSYNRISFIYDRRDDISIKYVCGIPIKESLILNKIKIYSNSLLFREYKFKYYKKDISLSSTTENYSFLCEIDEFVNGQTLCNPTKLCYGNESYSNPADIQIPDNLPLKNDICVTGDFDGNGRTDIVYFLKDELDDWAQYELFLNINGSFTIPYYGNIPSSFFPFFDDNPLLNCLKSIDINGDGKDELFIPTRVGNHFTYIPYSLEGTSFVSGSGLYCNYEHSFTAGDFDGNGQIDLFMFNNSSGIWMFYMNNSAMPQTGSGYFNEDVLFQTLNGNFYPIDFDGDGTTELISFNNTELIILDFEFLSPGIISRIKQIDHNSIYGISNLLTGDFNGDGIIDLLLKKHDFSGNYGWFYSYGDGQKNNSSYQYNQVPINLIITTDIIHDYNEKEITGDYNGDGLTDIVQFFKPENSATSAYYIYFSDGNGGFNKKEIRYLSNITYGSTFLSNGDFDGNGTDEIFIKRNAAENIVVIDNCREEYLLEKIYNGYGNLTEINYKPLTRNDVYLPDAPTPIDFPLVKDISPSLYVVKEVIIPDGIGGNNITSYFYRSLRMHKQGRGLLGFREITKTEGSFDKKTISTYGINAYYLSDLLSVSEKTLSNTPVSEVNNTYIYHDIYTGGLFTRRFFRYLSNSTINDYLNNKETATTYTYDSQDIANGNISSVSINRNNEITQTTDYSQYSSAGSYMPFRPQSVTTTTTYSGEPSFTQSESFTFYPDGGINTHTSNGITTKYDQYQCGIPTKTTITPVDADEVISTVTLDYTKRFPLFKKNPLEQVEKFEYDYKLCKLVKYTDINGLVYTYAYNNFGELISSTTPDGNSSEFVLDWSGNQVVGALYYKEITSSNAPSVKVFYDCFGREIQTGTQDFLSRYVITKTKYNNKGQVSETRGQSFEGSPLGDLTSYYYDAFGRCTTIDTPTGNIKYTYNPSQIIIKNLANLYVQKNFNVIGQLISVRDPYNNLSEYSYNSKGLCKDISTASTFISFEYDDYGHQTFLRDPNTGEIEYKYNALGELEYQIDARGNRFDMIYDLLGRMTNKTGNDGSTYSWTYNNKGYLTNESTNDNSISYTYDGLGRVLKQDETIFNVTYTTEYIYDSHGNISEVKYPSGLELTNIFNLGYHTETKLKSNNQSFWKLEAANALGQVQRVALGNELKTYFGYDPDHYLDYIKTGTSPTTDIKQDIDYTYDPVWGRPKFRGSVYQKETFEYDNLNRLTDVHLGDPPYTSTYSMTYLSDGNINTKTGIGQYQYEGPQPNAVTQIDGGIVSPNTQVITYNSFNKVETVSENNNFLEISYGTKQQRIKTEFTNGSYTKTKIYANNYEKINDNGIISELNYIYGPLGLTAICEKKDGVYKMYYTHLDHLGSINAITDEDKEVVQRMIYDAWGKRTILNIGTGTFFSDRGYTGHEHLDEFGLINMNGRMYDPLLGRFLSPDNNIQDPENMQNFNRYSYCLNNPLVYTDPSGESFMGFLNDAFEVVFMPFRVIDEGVNCVNAALNGKSGYSYDWNYEIGRASCRERV